MRLNAARLRSGEKVGTRAMQSLGTLPASRFRSQTLAPRGTTTASYSTFCLARV